MVNPLLGVTFHAIGGLAAGSFYLPYKGVRKWAWESYWLVGGFFSWIVAPWIAATFLVPDLWSVLKGAPVDSLIKTYAFGVLWGVGGLTFGLSMRYLGLSLGYALALGFCAAFGTIAPPMYHGDFLPLLTKGSGLALIGGVVVCLAGIAVCGLAGVRKEQSLPESEKQSVIAEFNFIKGVWVAVFAGLMSACMAFAFDSGKPIGERAVELGAPAVWQNLPVLIVALLGGFTTNFVWCLHLNIKNNTLSDYVGGSTAPTLVNYVLSALAGLIWYLQFFFYGMGTTQMGAYDFSSWTLHMAFIIVFSNLWGIALSEWRGVRKGIVKLLWLGIAILILSTIIIGFGNWLDAVERSKAL